MSRRRRSPSLTSGGAGPCAARPRPLSRQSSPPAGGGGGTRGAISPSIGPCCYEVDAPVIDQFAAAYPDRPRAWMTPGRDASHVMLDLWSANAALLQAAGVSADHVDNPRVCTACRLDMFYSY